MQQAQVRDLCVTLQRERSCGEHQYEGTAWFVTDAPSDSRLYEVPVSVRLNVGYDTIEGAFVRNGMQHPPQDIVSDILVGKDIIGVDDESIAQCVRNALNAQYAAHVQGIRAMPEHAREPR